jgi:hypothetical protein
MKCLEKTHTDYKLPLISASVVAYAVLATAWICQVDLIPFSQALL